jgi:hypothetical protein
LKKTGVPTIEERIQKRRDAVMEHVTTTRNMCEKCKNLGTASKNLLLNCHNDDAAEAL